MKAKIFFLAAAASVMMAACSSDETTTEQTMTLNLTTKNVVAETRSAAQDLQLTQFANGQSVGIFLAEDVNGTATLTGTDVTSYTQPLSYTADGAGNLANEQTWPADGNGLHIYGIYPANAATAYNATGVEFTVQANQSTDANYMASDLMTGAPTANPVARVSTPVALTFTHLLTKVNINLTAGTGFTAADLATATVSILGLKPTTTFSVQSTTVGTPSGTATDIIAGTGTVTSAIIVPSQSVAAGTNFIKVSCAGGDYIYQMGTATTFGASSVYTYNLTVNKTGLTLSTASITAWTAIGAVNGVAELQ
ncbi:MAG: fimbrillin family protein [Clostridia bacterium]|nr:fimbrillin family protein [Clostridia bacterium]